MIKILNEIAIDLRITFRLSVMIKPKLVYVRVANRERTAGKD